MKINGIEASPPIEFKQLEVKTMQQEKSSQLPHVKVPKALLTKAEQQMQPEYEQELNPELLQSAVDQLNETMVIYNTELKFELHEKSGEYMIKVLNQEDGTVIREIPPEKILNMVAYLKKTLGIIVDKFI